MKKYRRIIASLLLVLAATSANAKDYYVCSVKGNDTNNGSISAPFKTINHTAKVLISNDICYIREGVYQECIVPTESGHKEAPITFKAYKNECVIMDGSQSVGGNWKKHKGNIYKTSVKAEKIEQLFVDTTMMVEARWPNMTMNDIFERSKWAMCEDGSSHGKLVSKSVAASGIDFSGAQAYLNVAHQWWTWNREIKSHKAGSNELIYDADLVGLCSYTPQYMDSAKLAKSWADDYFYLFGVLGALDVECEWYFDKKKQELYFYAPDGVNPNSLNVRYKVLDYGFRAKDKNYLVIDGINFFACTFLLEDCNNCVVSNGNMKYPTYARTITEYDQNRLESVITKIVGDSNLVDKISLSYANNMGLMVMGNHNTVNNSIIHDINWSGTLIYPALQLSSSPHLGVNWFNTIQYPPTERTPENSEVTSVGNIASNNTLYNCGGSILVYHASESIVEYNHIYDGGKACKDVSLVYGCWPFSHSSEIRYNWVHGCQTDGYGDRSATGGIGIRADDQSRKNYFHHNVIWDCGELGITAKGEDNMIYNNTVLTSRYPILIPTHTEPFKEWAVQWPQLLIQNRWTRVFNNIACDIVTARNVKDSLVESNYNFSNYKGDKNPPLVDIESLDFRPQKNSKLIDTGIAPDYVNIKFSGSAPDMGAYEYGLEPWIPGAKWANHGKWIELIVKSQ